MKEVKVYADRLTLKTYEIGEADPNPFLAEYVGMPNFYPYPLKNKVADKPTDVEYKAYCLENEYFKLTVLPALGGKLYSCYDKRSGTDLFYRNPVVKPQMVGTTGAWTSGGIEFNFPNRGHRPSALDRADTTTRSYEDGSASLIVSDVDRISWQRFSVELRLYPSKAYIEQITRLYNPNDYDDSYYFWATSSELETPGLVWRYPVLWYLEEDDWIRRPWPYFHDGQDLRYNDTLRQFTLPFGSEALKDYIGLYDPASDSGVVHIADYGQVPGKKIWSWGDAVAGKLWCQRLTDNDDRYVELQAGSVETQNEFSFLEPHNKVVLKEYWLHSLANGPLGAASKDVICSYKLEGKSLNLSLLATARFPAAQVILLNGSEEKFTKTLALDPISSKKINVELELNWFEKDIELVIKSGPKMLLRETVLANDNALAVIDRQEYIPPKARPKSAATEAVRAEQFRFYNKAIKLNRELIEENPKYVGAHLRLARCYLKKGLAAEALATLEDLALADTENVALQYYYGLALWRLGRREEALRTFFKIPPASKLFGAASYFAAVDLVSKGRLGQAQAKLEYNLKFQPFHYKSRLLLAYVLIELGDYKKAAAVLREHLAANPIDYVAFYLQSMIGGEKECAGFLQRAQNAYEVLTFLHELKDYQGCLEFLQSCGLENSLLAAYQNYYQALLSKGDYTALKEAVESLDLTYVFPNHRLDGEILSAVINDSPKARYLYGLVHYGAENYTEAKRQWEVLAAQDYNYSVLYRNLAFYYQKHEQDYTKAVETARQGLTKEPLNHGLAEILAHCYLQLGDEVQITRLTEAFRAKNRLTENETRVLANLLNHLGEHEKAAEVLNSREFRMWEYCPENVIPFTKLYADTYFGLARQALAKKDYKTAAEAIEKCLTMEKRYEEKFAKQYFYMAVIQEKLGNFPKALEYYRKVIDERIDREDEANYRFFVKAAQRLVKLEWIGIR